MSPQEKLRNIGRSRPAWLRQVGLRTREDLEGVGAVDAFMRVKRAGFKPSLNLLYALEGALLDCHGRRCRSRDACRTGGQRRSQDRAAARAARPPRRRPRHHHDDGARRTPARRAMGWRCSMPWTPTHATNDLLCAHAGCWHRLRPLRGDPTAALHARPEG